MTMQRGALLGIGLAVVVTVGAAFFGAQLPVLATPGSSVEPSSVPAGSESAPASPITPIDEIAVPNVDVSLAAPTQLASLGSGPVAALASTAVQAAADPLKASTTVYINATPRTGDADLFVTFTDATVPSVADGPIACWEWELDLLSVGGFPVTIRGCDSSYKVVSHTYTVPGSYSVRLTLTFRDPLPNGDTNQVTRRFDNFIVVTGTSDVPSASLAATSGIIDGTALVPLNDWMPLMFFTMSYSEDKYAPRVLESLSYEIVCDRYPTPPRPWDVCGCPGVEELLEFSLWQDWGSDGPDGVYDPDHDWFLYSWDNLGYPFDLNPGDTFYELDFVNDFNDLYDDAIYGPYTPFENWSLAHVDKSIESGYILMVRTSSLWQHGTGMGFILRGIFMNAFTYDGDYGRYVPGGALGKDNYSPDKLSDVDADIGYSSSFGVFDISGHEISDYTYAYDNNTWNWHSALYSPSSDHVRPVWNLLQGAIETSVGEWLDLRRLCPLESWIPVLGINLHGFELQPGELNLICTDIGADPYGMPGNGGFDPTDGLESFTTEQHYPGTSWQLAYGRDYAFNGVWIYHDTNNNGSFDPPTPNPNGGVTFTDAPLFPRDWGFYGRQDLDGQIVYGLLEWQYDPFPPAGGDPWWKIKMAFSGGRRRYPGSLEPKGFSEPIPDGSPFTTEKCDYFVVLRADSGYTDISTRLGDGKPLELGADTRAFVEPRRINPRTGFLDGGIRIQGSLLSDFLGPTDEYMPWQEDPRLDYPHVGEPWWTERTHNALNTKPVRWGLDVHDLVLTYDSDNDYAKTSPVHYYDYGSFFCPGYYSNFASWTDPFAVLYDQFYFGSYAMATQIQGYASPDIINDEVAKWQYPFESAPFYNSFLHDPRSFYYPVMPPQPTLPNYYTWPQRSLVAYGDNGTKSSIMEGGEEVFVFDVPGQVWPEDYYVDHWLIDWMGGAYLITGNGPSRLFLYHADAVLDGNWIITTDALTRGRYPHISNWPEGLAPAGARAARLLKQHVDSPTTPDAINTTGITNSVAMLGLNLVGADDPFVNRYNTMMLQSVTVAFWGPTFNPWNDLLALDPNGTLPGSGVLLWEDRNQTGIFEAGLGDAIVPLKSCAWTLAPEPIDLDGDFIADDLNGDGVADTLDYAWVLKLIAKDPWIIADNDLPDRGDDLFIAVRTSRNIERFEQFRAMIPARLPSRTPASVQIAGVELLPRAYLTVHSFEKNNPEEGAVQDYYSHDMLEANVSTDVYNLTTPGQKILPGGPPTAVLGVDVSTNRPASESTLATGTDGVASPPNQFSTPGKTWTGAVIGDWLIGKSSTGQIEGYKVTGASGSTLTLLSGTPGNGKYMVVRDPTFLEQIMVEVYDEGQDGRFNLASDLLPLNFEDPSAGLYSGVSIYRDNDWHTGNTNGVFDPDIDIPVALDQLPARVGLVGEPDQVRFVFSSPGTDDIMGLEEVLLSQQPRRRQWIPDSFGVSNNDPDYGSDFFVVVRTSQTMDLGDDFRLAIVSWGPNTPTEPDPDQFPNYLPGTGAEVNEFDLFSEFPWGSRALGFITLFKSRQPYNYWGYDQAARKQYPKVEYDHSQDETKYRYWVRSSANRFGQTNVITSLASPVVDFRANYTRRASGEPIQFTSLSTGQIALYFWDFGDGQTATGAGLGTISHSYAGPGFYTVSLSVTDALNTTRTATKVNYIEIVDLPFADFVGTPTDAVMALDLESGLVGVRVAFTDMSVGTQTGPPISFAWNFGDNGSSTEQNPEHVYTVDGTYSVRLTTTFLGGAVDTFTRSNYIVVRPPAGEGEGEGEGGEGEGEGETPEVPTTSIAIEDGIKSRDKDSLLPLMDWMPLFHIRMTWDSEDAPAPRILESLMYTVRRDPRASDDLGYDNNAGLEVSDILEFALFRETGDDDEIDGVLDERDYVVYYWDNMGYPLGELVDYTPGSLRYELDFVGNGTLAQPQFPLREGMPEPGNSYIVAVRTSATWRSSLTLAYTVDHARMYPFPTGDDGAPSDSYSPNFYDGETLDEEIGYSSSFSAFDITNGPVPGQRTNWVNNWMWPSVLSTPLAEHSRPRWDAAGTLFNLMTGEWMQMRTLFPLEQWVPAVGINLHSGGMRTVSDATHSHWTLDDVPYAVMEEINIVVTDIGADPLGPEGNGGLNPKEAFDPVIGWRGPVVVDEAIGEDHAFNGIWVWHDTNNNGIFDPPTPMAGGGAKLVDMPMAPGFGTYDFDDLGYTGYDPDWQYVPFPPGGGDPWWKIKLSLIGWSRAGTDTDGALEHSPDGVGQNQYKPDYFVVVRGDSGYQDISLSPADGAGMEMGADFRVFIEPRRYNAIKGQWDGGIYVDSQIPAVGSEYYGVWQDDERWGTDEPWWPQRTINATNTKPMRTGLEIHDLVNTYESNNHYAKSEYIHYGTDWFFIDIDWDEDDVPTTSSAFLGGYQTWFDMWLDPFGLRQSQFYNYHSVGVWDWAVLLHVTLGDNYGVFVDDRTGNSHFPYETAPFFSSNFDALPHGPRSTLYATPAAQPSLPSYDTWPATITPGIYPRASDWARKDRQARLLKQHVDIFSGPTAMLGFNLIGADDPIVNLASPVKLDYITVAFWGPEFDPAKLASLDPDGMDSKSGVMLYEDTSHDGTFLWSDITGAATLFGTDTAVALDGLQWRGAPEPIDIDGDGIPDDMNGDGRADTADYAWVLRLQPKATWKLPTRDEGSVFDWLDEATKSGGGGAAKSSGAAKSGGAAENGGAADASAEPMLIDLEALAQNTPIEKAGPEKAVETNNQGDDLFLVVRTSDQLAALEGFRAVVPATLPSRQGADRVGGVQFLPTKPMSESALLKLNAEEGPVQDFFGHDMLEANVPVKVVDVTARPQTIARGGTVIPLMGFDISTNRPQTTLATGTSATTSAGSFSVSSATWTPGAFANCWLLDERYEPYLITGNSRNQLVLLSGTPKGGPWRIVKDPTFLEQVIVEFYGELAAEGEGEGEGEGSVLPTSRFNLSQHLLPLDIDPKLSGVALFRDNDNDPRNRNGSFDPDIDIPVLLDCPPLLVGRPGEPDTQVKFIFSSPGTDDWPVPMAQQARRRQWVPDSFGIRTGDANQGPDFFVVVRASTRMPKDTVFTAAVVSWGPNTPTEPDPDTFILPTSPGTATDHFDMFSEFPWGSRALGFVTFFKEPAPVYTMDNFTARREFDSSANFVRTSSSIKRKTGLITARDALIGPYSVAINSVSQTKLPATILSPAGFSFVINGQGFGTGSVVALTGYDATVTQCTNTTINCTIHNSSAGLVPKEPLVLIVRNPDSNEESSRDDLFTLTTTVPQTAPTISGVSPSSGSQADFPITIQGANFNPKEDLEVLLGRTVVPVNSVSADGKSITVLFPFAGLPQSGPLDVIVRNLEAHSTKSAEAVLVNGFTYVSQPVRTQCFIATAAYGSPMERHLPVFRDFRDDVLLKSSAGASVVSFYYRHSPEAAVFIARHPAVAACVRGVLTPVALVLENPVVSLVAVLGAIAGAAVARRRKCAIRIARSR